jgi:hypothetical protein
MTSFTYRDVFYPRIVQVPDQATATKELVPGTIVLIMPGMLAKWLKFYCPCGCGEVISVNLAAATAKAWRVRYEENYGLTVWPSVWRDTGCKSHFIIRRNTARLLFGKPPRGSDEDRYENEDAQW